MVMWNCMEDSAGFYTICLMGFLEIWLQHPVTVGVSGSWNRHRRGVVSESRSTESSTLFFLG